MMEENGPAGSIGMSGRIPFLLVLAGPALLLKPLDLLAARDRRQGLEHPW
jgi:hypothetical protein